MNFFYFLNVNKSKFQKSSKGLNVGNSVNFEVKLALEKLRERNLNVFSKLYFESKDVIEISKSKNYNISKDHCSLADLYYHKNYYKNISKIYSYGKNRYSYFSNYNTNSYNINDLKLFGSISFLNYGQTLTSDDFYENFFISYGGYVSSLIEKSFTLNSFFILRKRNFFSDYKRKVYSLLSANSIFLKKNFLFSYYFPRDHLSDDLGIRNNSLIQKFQDLNNIYDFLYSQRRNNKNLLKRKSIYSHYGMFKKYIGSQSINNSNFRLFGRFFYSLSKSNLVNYIESFFIPANFSFSDLNVKKIHNEFFIIKNTLNYILSSFLLSNNNIFKAGLVSKLLFFILFKAIFNLKMLSSNFDLKERGAFLFNKFYLLSLIVFNNRIYFDGLKNNHNVLLLNNYMDVNFLKKN